MPEVAGCLVLCFTQTNVACQRGMKIILVDIPVVGEKNCNNIH